jgi:putative redox protein
MEWTGEGLRFHGGAADGQTPSITLDPSKEAGPSPMDTLLLAAAGCAGADVVSILQKMKVNLDSVSIGLVGERRSEHPKRYVALQYVFQLRGDNLDRAKAERAVSLSLNKYCSVVLGLNPDVRVDYEIEIL